MRETTISYFIYTSNAQIIQMSPSSCVKTVCFETVGLDVSLVVGGGIVGIVGIVGAVVTS